MKTPMPSPNGTNRAGLYISSRVQAAYDAAPDDGPSDASALMDDNGSPHADSVQAHRILSACIDKLSKADMASVMKMMKDAGLLSDDEVRAITSGMDDNGTQKSDMASDAAIRATRRKLYEAGKLSYDHLMAPIVRQSPEERASFMKMFPNAARLK